MIATREAYVAGAEVTCFLYGPVGRFGFGNVCKLLPTGKDVERRATARQAIHLTLPDLSLAILNIVSRWIDGQPRFGQWQADDGPMRPGPV